MGVYKNLSGDKFGRWTVIRDIGRNQTGQVMWLCKCECGTEKIVNGTSLIHGRTKSCGCYRSELSKKLVINICGWNKLSNEDRYLRKLIRMAKERCNNPRNSSFTNYGARGICVFGEWAADPQKFADYVKNNLGNRPSHKYSLDRIDNDRGYEPGNLRWATRGEQNRNRRKQLFNPSKANKILTAALIACLNRISILEKI